MKVTSDKLTALVSTYYDVYPSDIYSSSRKQEFITPRHVIMFLLQEDYKLSDTKISQLLNRKSRSTVYNAVNKIKNLKVYDKEITTDILNIRRYINNPELLTVKNRIPNLSVKKRIYQLSEDMEEIKNYSSVSEASSLTGISNSTIIRSLGSYKRLGGGFYWKKK